VLLAVIEELGTYDRVQDTVSRAQLVAATGIEERDLRRALQRLADRGVIGLTPGSSPRGGRRTASFITLDPQRTGGQVDPGSDCPRPGGDLAPDRGVIWPPTGGSQDPPSEVFSEAFSDGGDSEPLAVIARRITKGWHSEIPAALAPLLEAYGEGAVRAALADFERRGRRFAGARGLASALTEPLDSARARAVARSAEARTRARAAELATPTTLEEAARVAEHQAAARSALAPRRAS